MQFSRYIFLHDFFDFHPVCGIQRNYSETFIMCYFSIINYHYKIYRFKPINFGKNRLKYNLILTTLILYLWNHSLLFKCNLNTNVVIRLIENRYCNAWFNSELFMKLIFRHLVLFKINSIFLTMSSIQLQLSVVGNCLM